MTDLRETIACIVEEVLQNKSLLPRDSSCTAQDQSAFQTTTGLTVSVDKNPATRLNVAEWPAPGAEKTPTPQTGTSWAAIAKAAVRSNKRSSKRAAARSVTARLLKQSPDSHTCIVRGCALSAHQFRLALAAAEPASKKHILGSFKTHAYTHVVFVTEDFKDELPRLVGKVVLEMRSALPAQEKHRVPDIQVLDATSFKPHIPRDVTATEEMKRKAREQAARSIASAIISESRPCVRQPNYPFQQAHMARARLYCAYARTHNLENDVALAVDMLVSNPRDDTLRQFPEAIKQFAHTAAQTLTEDIDMDNADDTTQDQSLNPTAREGGAVGGL